MRVYESFFLWSVFWAKQMNLKEFSYLFLDLLYFFEIFDFPLTLYKVFFKNFYVQSNVSLKIKNIHIQEIKNTIWDNFTVCTPKRHNIFFHKIFLEFFFQSFRKIFIQNYVSLEWIIQIKSMNEVQRLISLWKSNLFQSI